MSDPASKQEIEDVLASIRRLVTSDPKPFARPESQPSEGARRLVLTPAHRVDESATVARQGVLDDSLPEDEGTPEVEDNPQAEAVGGDRPEAEADTLDDIPPDDILSDDGPEADDDATLQERIAGLEAMVAARDEEWDPDGLLTENSAGPTDPLPWGAEEDQPASEDVADDTCIEAADGAPDAREPDPLPAAREDAAPRGADAAAESHPAEWEDYDDAAAEDDEDDEDMSITAIDADDAVLDEEALRDLVAEIVRQELQGSLGERITRNVRKLVRREIHRALAGQAFD